MSEINQFYGYTIVTTNLLYSKPIDTLRVKKLPPPYFAIIP